MSHISPIRTLIGGYACIEMFLRHPRSALRFFFFFCAELGVLRLTRGSNQLMLEAVTLTNNPGSLELSRGHRRGKTIMATVAEGAPGLPDVHRVSNV